MGLSVERIARTLINRSSAWTRGSAENDARPGHCPLNTGFFFVKNAEMASP